MKKEDGCLRFDDNCQGNLEQRFTTLGTEIWECAYHAREMAKWRRQLNERYPDSPVAPEWFDPSYAGESWDDD